MALPEVDTNKWRDEVAKMIKIRRQMGKTEAAMAAVPMPFPFVVENGYAPHPAPSSISTLMSKFFKRKK